GAATRGGLPLGDRPAIRAARSRCRLRGRVLEPSPDHGDPRSQDSASVALAEPYVERLIGTLRRECLDHVVVLNEPHLRRLLRAYLIYYPGGTHLSLAKDAPEPRRVERLDEGQIVETPMAGGLHHRYGRRAASAPFCGLCLPPWRRPCGR